MKEMMNWIANEEEGQGMVEYALILALVAVGCIAILGTLKGSINNIFQNASNELGKAGGNAGNAG